jgi:hypothetical protein
VYFLVLSSVSYNSSYKGMLYPINSIAMDDCKAGTCIVPAGNDASLIAGVVAEGLESPTSMAFAGGQSRTFAGCQCSEYRGRRHVRN